MLIERVTEFCEDYHSQFTFAARSADGGAGASTVFRADTKPVLEKNESRASGSSGIESYDDLYKRVLVDVERHMKVSSLEAKLKEKEKELEGITSQGDKLAYVGTRILESIFIKEKKTTTLAGGKGFSSIPGQDENEVDDQTKTATEVKEVDNPELLAQSIDTLHEKGLTDLIIHLAKNDAQIARALKRLVEITGEKSFIDIANGMTPEKFKMLSSMV